MSNLNERLYNHEVNPPANSWDRIKDALNDSELQHQFPNRLYNFEVTPPAGVWQAVSNSLEPGTRSIAPVRRLSPFFRYAAAAILIAALIYGISRFGISDSRNEYAAKAIPIKDTNRGSVTPAENNTTAVTTELPKENNETRPAKTFTAKAGSVHGKSQSGARHAVYTPSHEVDKELFQSIYAYADHVPDIADRYVMLMTPDGKLIRMSKKWSDLVCCVAGEEQDADCKSQLRKWQEKIAASSLAPAPGNFMDILGLVNSLDESNGL